MLWLLSQNDFGLLEEQLQSAHVAIGAYLGRGASSIVFEATSSSTPSTETNEPDEDGHHHHQSTSVIKLIKRNNIYDIGEYEASVLNHLEADEATRRLVGTMIPKLVSHNKDFTSLELAPKASRFSDASPFTGRHAVETLQVLQAAHSAGIVHCDIRPDNLLLGPNGHVLVNDWGAANFFEEGTEQPYLGARRHASNDVLQMLAKDPTMKMHFKPEDDLVGFVRAMCALLVPEMRVPHSVMEPADVLQHWTKMPPFWKDLEGMAERALYESIEIEIEKVFVTIASQPNNNL